MAACFESSFAGCCNIWCRARGQLVITYMLIVKRFFAEQTLLEISLTNPFCCRSVHREHNLQLRQCQPLQQCRSLRQCRSRQCRWHHRCRHQQSHRHRPDFQLPILQRHGIQAMHGLTLAGWRGRSDHDEPAWPNAAGGTRCSQCSYTYICTRMHIITMDRHRPWWCRSLATMCRPWTLTLTTYAKDVIELQRWKLSCWCMRSGSCSWDDVQHASSNLEAWAVAYSCCPFVGVRHEHVCELQVVATRSHWMGVPSSTQLSLCACCSCHIICHCVSQAWLESAHPSQGGAGFTWRGTGSLPMESGMSRASQALCTF